MRHTVRVALLQLRAFGLKEARESLQHTLAKIEEAGALRPDLVVLPEVTYPAYFLGSPDRYPNAEDPSPQEALAALSQAAVDQRFHIAAGLALEAPGGGLTNSAVLIAPDGELLGRYDKCLLWDFDRHWFVPGARYPVFETELGRLGLLICADGRLPEIARSLAVGGAQILVDLTAWVSWGRRPAELTNPQREYMMAVRALENGVWVVAASKLGLEADSIVYCGRSCVIDPQGRVVATASADREEILTYELDLEGDAQPPVERRPELYAELTTLTAELPVVPLLDKPLAPRAGSQRLAAVSLGDCASEGDLLGRLARFVRTLRRQDTDVIVFSEPSVSGRLALATQGLRDALASLSREEGGLLAVTLREETEQGAYKTGYLWMDGRTLLGHRQTHLSPTERESGLLPGDVACPVAETAMGRVGLMLGAEGLVPEVARCLMLKGADILLWPAGELDLDLLPVARCRADENRLFVVAAAPGLEGGAYVVGPGGQVLASALQGVEMAANAQVNLALACWKDMAPGTNVVLSRQPETYGPLVASP
jgi:predicted amidohydrolase